jgi:hypothetical protein
MRVLLIDPEDDLQGEPWGFLRWDRVIDLGGAGAEAYARAAAGFRCSVIALNGFRENFREMRRVRDLMAVGMGQLTDSFGLDWWELTAILVHEYLEIAFLLGELTKSFGSQDEVHVSRPGLYADILRLPLGTRVHTFPMPAHRQRGGLRHYIKTFRKFPALQLLEILWDKTDAGYQIRGSFSSKPKPQADAVVLTPSSYVNVSRTAAEYAEILPEARFLLVATRRSGWIKNLPTNVVATWLRRYASLRIPSRKLEYRDLLKRWGLLRNDLRAVPEIRTLDELGYLNRFSNWFARGLEIRDAWRNVLESEPVQAVICADDTNPHTHIPLLLAAHRGLPTIACHHGALDGRYMFKRTHADVVLVKGEMEKDYLVRGCAIPPKRVEIGAPARPAYLREEAGDKSCIVFFSEPYEVGGGRSRSFYEDILPPLAEMAWAEKKKLVIKLHPSESLSERSHLVKQILRPAKRRVTLVVGGTLQAELMNHAWFGVAVLSTVAVECALRGIPCFLCAWLESSHYGYVAQFARFNAGIRLEKAGDLREIPNFLRSYQKPSAVRENCWTPIKAERLRELLRVNGQSPALAERKYERVGKDIR